jgi:hypothetical protein
MTPNTGPPAQHFRRGHEQAHLDDKGQGPQAEERPYGLAAAGLRVVSVGGDNHHPVPDTRQNGDHRGPAKPPQRPRHEQGYNLDPGRTLHFLQEGCVHQNEEVKKTDPENARDKVNPAQQQLQVGSDACGERDVGRGDEKHGELLKAGDSQPFETSDKKAGLQVADKKSPLIYADRR